MRLVVKKYADGGTFAVETSNAGELIIQTLEGERDIGERISAYVEVICDDTEEGIDRLVTALSWLKDEANRRKLMHADKERKKKKKATPAEH